jgi:chromosome condensin MukBEF ATPase and DNA-binding subunit MukB
MGEAVTMTNYEREMGAVGVKLEALEKDVADMKSDLREIRDALNQAKGGWRILMMVSGASGAIGAGIVKFLPFLASLPR